MEARKLVLLIMLASCLVHAFLISAENQESGQRENDEEIPKASNTHKKEDDHAVDNQHVCRSETCKQRGNLINWYINRSADPCKDFYSYVCGGWVSKNKNRSRYDAFKMLQEQFVDVLRGLLQEAEIVYRNQSTINKAAVLYNACVAVQEPDDGHIDLLEIMSTNGLAQWPITGHGSGQDETFKNITNVFLTAGMDPVVQFYVGKGIYRTYMNELKIYALGLRNFFTEDQVKESAKFVKKTITESDLQNLAASLSRFQQKWNNLTVNSSGNMLFPIPITLDTLEKNFTSIPLLKLLNKEFGKANITLSGNETVEVFTWDSYTILDEFLQTSTPMDLFNYIGLQFVLAWRAHTSLHKKYHPKEFYSLSRSTECAALVHDAMNEVTSYLYAKKKLSGRAKSQVEEVVKRLKEVLKESLKNATWMDAQSRTAAERKLAKMGAKIGYPPWLMDTAVLADHYKYLPDFNESSSFVKMAYAAKENNDRRMMERINTKYDPDLQWYFGLSAVTTLYNPRSNEFVCPLGGLQSPFYEYDLPWSLTMGGIGAVIAHEMTHAFAGRASHFNEDGKPQRMNLTYEYQNRNECFVKQYQNVIQEEMNITINGGTALDENIADSSGLELAYEAYQKMVIEDCDNTTTSLETLANISGPQLFFITYGMSWCSTVTPETLQSTVMSMRYSPNQYRVNLPAQNLPAFAAAFKCSSDAAMAKNSGDKCSLWRPISTNEGSENATAVI